MGLGSNKIELSSNNIEIGSDKIKIGSNKIDLGSDKEEYGKTKLKHDSGGFEQNGRDATSYKIYMSSKKISHRILKQRTMKKTNSR